jgi:hypothetical protein
MFIGMFGVSVQRLRKQQQTDKLSLLPEPLGGVNDSPRICSAIERFVDKEF